MDIFLTRSERFTFLQKHHGCGPRRSIDHIEGAHLIFCTSMKGASMQRMVLILVASLLLAISSAVSADDVRILCVFDYDLTLSSNKCSQTANNPRYHCLQTDCITYNWRDQCLAVGAREVIAECVRRGAIVRRRAWPSLPPEASTVAAWLH